MDKLSPPSSLDRTDLTRLRALLFVPVLRDRLVASALKVTPPAVILDLEDSIPAREKTAARAAIQSLAMSFRKACIPVFIRVNRDDVDDLETCRISSPDGVFLPEVEKPDEAEKVVWARGRGTPRGRSW